MREIADKIFRSEKAYNRIQCESKVIKKSLKVKTVRVIH